MELQFWHSISNQNHLKVLEGLVEEFNETIGAEKGITVVPTFNGSSSELYSSVVGAIKAGSAPDVTLALRPMWPTTSRPTMWLTWSPILQIPMWA